MVDLTKYLAFKADLEADLAALRTELVGLKDTLAAAQSAYDSVNEKTLGLERVLALVQRLGGPGAPQQVL